MKNLGPSCPRYVFVFFTRSNGYGSVCHEPFPITNFFTFYFRWREGVPTSVLGSQPIIWLLPSSLGQAILLGLLDVTPVRLLLIQTSVGLHPNLHSFLTVCHCSFQREDSSHPTSIVSVGYHVTIYIHTYIFMHTYTYTHIHKHIYIYT